MNKAHNIVKYFTIASVVYLLSWMVFMGVDSHLNHGGYKSEIEGVIIIDGESYDVYGVGTYEWITPRQWVHRFAGKYWFQSYIICDYIWYPFNRVWEWKYRRIDKWGYHDMRNDFVLIPPDSFKRRNG